MTLVSMGAATMSVAPSAYCVYSPPVASQAVVPMFRIALVLQAQHHCAQQGIIGMAISIPPKSPKFFRNVYELFYECCIKFCQK